jgi:hypothetical protein
MLPTLHANIAVVLIAKVKHMNSQLNKLFGPNGRESVVNRALDGHPG